ncbi:MAG TPA: ABC transporter substrate-binding protein, partial [Acidimicrobiia bacterium]|nr:ABC transporter substrate-binding protein [Acidimicrobiia bacterium]
MSRARYRDNGVGSGLRMAGSRAVRVMALVSMVGLAAVGCGNRSSSDKLNALLNGNGQGTAAPAPAAGAPATPDAGSGAGATSPDAAASAAAPGGAASAGVSGSSTGATSRSASAATPSGSATPGSKSAASAGPSGGPAKPGPGSAGGAGPSSTPGAATPGAPGAPATPGGTPTGCSGSEPPIVIGSVGTMSGVVGYLFAPGAKAVSAWAAEINEKGGVNCHPVKHLIGDSGGDPARYQALVRQFVEREGVIAFVFNPDSFAAQAGADYLEQKQVPVIGGGGGEMFTYDKSMQFPVFGMGVPMQINQVFQASRVWIPAGKKKIGTVACVEAEYCPIFDKTVKEFGPKFGFDLVYQADVTITAPDYTANCLEARNSGVQAFVTSLDGQTNQRLINSCAKVGFNVPIAAASIQG